MNTAVVLPVERRLHVAQYARGALMAADAIGRIPTPIDEVAAAMKLSTPQELFDLADVPPALAQRLRRLKHKVKGALDVRSRVIYVARDQLSCSQRFTYGHEIGHALPWHKDAYYGDDCTTLDPDTRDELEAEASAFSAELLFNLDEFTMRAHSTRPSLATALNLAEQFETSRHSAIRRYAEDAPRSCALLIMGRFPIRPDGNLSLRVMRKIESADFRDRYGPISQCMPDILSLDQWALARDALDALKGRAADPITGGTITLKETRRGAVAMDYELFTNTYQVFALITPHHRITLRQPVRAEWKP